MNLAVGDVQGAVLVVSQFTLLGDCRGGRRPSYIEAAPPETANALYEAVVAARARRRAHRSRPAPSAPTWPSSSSTTARSPSSSIRRRRSETGVSARLLPLAVLGEGALAICSAAFGSTRPACRCAFGAIPGRAIAAGVGVALGLSVVAMVAAAARSRRRADRARCAS